MPLFRMPGPFDEGPSILRERTLWRRTERSRGARALPFLAGVAVCFAIGGAAGLFARGEAGGPNLTPSGHTAATKGDPCSADLPGEGSIFAGKVDHIIDGDGLCIDGIEVRLADFNAPEWNQKGGAEASAMLERLAFEKRVECRACEGVREGRRCISYDRIVATCRIDGIPLGDLLRAKGLAEGGR